MGRPKTKGWLLLTFVLVVVAMLADAGFTRRQERSIREELRAYDIVGAHADRVVEGMSRAEAEHFISGYRQYSIFDSGDEITYTYRYWYGFIPPVRVLRYKTVGSIRITYSREEKVLSTSYWYS